MAKRKWEVERLVRTVKKVIKTANLERKSWKQEVYRFLRNFRATPHTTTRIPPVTEGDTVFVRRDDTKRKRDTPYRPEPYVVIAKKGSMVTVRNKSGKVTRNSSFFKKASIEIPETVMTKIVTFLCVDLREQ